MKPSDFTYPEAAAALRQQGIIPDFAALRQPTLLSSDQSVELKKYYKVKELTGTCHTKG